MVNASILLAALLSGPSVDAPPMQIAGGDTVEPCAYPATVATVLDPQGSWGTGSLVHPRVVLYSAHSGVDFEFVFLGDHITGIPAFE